MRQTILPQRRRLMLEKGADAVFEMPYSGDNVAEVVAAEGLEDALAIFRFGKRRCSIIGLPGIGTLRHLTFSNPVRITIVRDGDAPDSAAVKALQEGIDHLILAGHDVHVTALPPPGLDANAILQEAGVDAIITSGFEAGGHRGSFLRPAEDSLMGTLSLVPQVVDVVDVPVIAAGGIGDARGVIAAFALGADAIQMGTAFLACEESGAGRLHREALYGRKAGHTGLTRGFTGRLARGIHNLLMEELNRPETQILPYPLQRSLVRNLSIAAEAAGRPDLLPLWAGQSANLSTSTDVTAFLTSLVETVSEIAGPVMHWSATRRQKLVYRG